MLNWTAIGSIVAAVALLVTVMTLVSLRGSRLAKMESDITYIRRDVDSILRLFKLVPASEQDRKRR
jgi:hypothetical protein